MASLRRPTPTHPRGIRIGVATVAIALAGVGTVAPPGAAQAEPTGSPTVVIVIASDAVDRNLDPATPDRKEPRDRLLRRYATLGLRTGLMSTTQGEYSQRQSLLDLSQGTRQPQAVYGRSLGRTSLVERSNGWAIEGWRDVRERARGASTTIRPGLLATAAGGATFVASRSGSEVSSLVAADESGGLGSVSVGNDDTVVDRYRTAAASGGDRLIVVSQPSGRRGEEVLAGIVASASAETLVIAVHLPPTPPDDPPIPKPGARFSLQTAVGVGAKSPGVDALRSASTRRTGLIAAIDIAPTVLSHLGVPEPASMRGHPVESAEMSTARMEELRRRWSLVRSGRQGEAIQATVMLALAVVVITGFFRSLPDALRMGTRTLGLALMAVPATAVLVAPLEPDGASGEGLMIAGGAVALALLVDRTIRWPSAPLVPAMASLVVVAGDLAMGGSALAASAIGPSVASGNRFYGISNELEPVLPSLTLAALAAAFAILGRKDGRRTTILGAYVAAGLVLAIVVTSGRLGADVGGIVTIAGAFVVAALISLQIRPSARLVVAAVVASAVGGLLLLIVADQLAGSDSHLSNNLQRIQSPGEFFELFTRRYQLAAHVAAEPAQLFALAAAVTICAFVYRHRVLLLGDLPTPPWRAALVGTLAGGVAGALSNDSGPVLFVNAVVAAGAIALYLSGGRTERDQTETSATRQT